MPSRPTFAELLAGAGNMLMDRANRIRNLQALLARAYVERDYWRAVAEDLTPGLVRSVSGGRPAARCMRRTTGAAHRACPGRADKTRHTQQVR